jgi:hypothetical protein
MGNKASRRENKIRDALCNRNITEVNRIYNKYVDKKIIDETWIIFDKWITNNLLRNNYYEEYSKLNDEIRMRFIKSFDLEKFLKVCRFKDNYDFASIHYILNDCSTNSLIKILRNNKIISSEKYIEIGYFIVFFREKVVLSLKIYHDLIIRSLEVDNLEYALIFSLCFKKYKKNVSVSSEHYMELKKLDDDLILNVLITASFDNISLTIKILKNLKIDFGMLTNDEVRKIFLNALGKDNQKKVNYLIEIYDMNSVFKDNYIYNKLCEYISANDFFMVNALCSTLDINKEIYDTILNRYNEVSDRNIQIFELLSELQRKSHQTEDKELKYSYTKKKYDDHDDYTMIGHSLEYHSFSNLISQNAEQSPQSPMSSNLTHELTESSISLVSPEPYSPRSSRG